MNDYNDWLIFETVIFYLDLYILMLLNAWLNHKQNNSCIIKLVSNMK